MRAVSIAALLAVVACHSHAPSSSVPPAHTEALPEAGTAPPTADPLETQRGDASADPATLELPADARWVKLPAPDFAGKQDDITFVNENVGWYANGKGQLFRTDDGGERWTQVLSQPGTYWRALGFVDENVGYLGNIGTEYFPGVTDPTPLYRTLDGGVTVQAVATGAPSIKGLCAIDVLEAEFINAGVLAKRTVIHAGGRVGGPAWLLRSLDGGETWKTLDLNEHIASITDVRFLSESVGFVVGGSSSNIARSHAAILKTIDGGETWTRVYTSSRPYEMGWKISLPTEHDGFATVQNYDANVTEQVVARTRDGGATWDEVALVDDAAAREFGVGFISPTTGWVGTAAGGFQTTDGGATWTPVEFGRFVNKIRIVPASEGFVAFAIGAAVHRLDARPARQRD